MTTTTTSPFRPRRPLQFRLRTFLVVMMVAALLLAVYGAYWRSERRESRALSAVSDQAGLTESQVGLQIRTSEYWLTTSRVIHLHLSFDPSAEPPPLEMDRWRQVRELRSLERVGLQNRPILPDEVAVFRGIPRLSQLTLLDCDLRPGVLEAIGSLKSLESLRLSGCRFDEQELIHLKGLAKLNSLDLSHCAVTEAAVSYLMELPALRTLHSDNTALDDEALQPLIEARPMLMVLDD